jgi:hypothetical protein
MLCFPVIRAATLLDIVGGWCDPVTADRRLAPGAAGKDVGPQHRHKYRLRRAG